MMDEVLIPLTVVPILFIGLPWLIFHYITKWKTAAKLTGSDERLLDELHDAARRLDELQASWTEKAELALSKDREDLAKAALMERQKAGDMAAGLKAEIAVIDETLKSYEADIGKLQGKLREARARQNAIATRFESAVTRAKAREMLNGGRTEDAFSRFEILERRADFAEGRADALGMTGPKSLEEEIAELKSSEKVDAELEAMKAARAAKGD